MKGLPALVLIVLGCLLAPSLTQAAPGDLDRSFGIRGKVRAGVDCHCEARALAIDSRGRIVVAGDNSPFRGDFALARLKTDGRLDRTFSGDGYATTDLGGSDSASSVAIDSEGRIIVGGNGGIVRYEPNGALDPSFGTGGMVTSGLARAASSLAIDSDGRIVVAGGSNQDFAVARYMDDGSPDPSFGHAGLLTTDFGGRNDYASSVAIDSRGRIVAVGSRCDEDFVNCDFALARYTEDGRLDQSFGHFGKADTTFGADDEASAVAIDSRDRIVAAGFGQRNGRSMFALARYRPDGSRNRSFSNDGKVLTSFGQDGARASAVAIDSRGRIVAAGGTHGNRCCASHYALARYKEDGRPDRSFSRNGKVRTFSRYLGAQAAVIDSRDRILAADGRGKFVVYRYLG